MMWSDSSWGHGGGLGFVDVAASLALERVERCVTRRFQQPSGERIGVADRAGAGSAGKDDENGLRDVLCQRGVAKLTPGGGVNEIKVTFDECFKGRGRLRCGVGAKKDGVGLKVHCCS